MFVGTSAEFGQLVKSWRERRSKDDQQCLCHPLKYVRSDGLVELYLGDQEMQGCPIHCKHLGILQGGYCVCGHRVV